MKKQLKRRNIGDRAEIDITIGGRKKKLYSGSIYSKQFWKSVRVIVQKYHGGKTLPSELRKLTEPLESD